MFALTEGQEAQVRAGAVPCLTVEPSSWDALAEAAIADGTAADLCRDCPLMGQCLELAMDAEGSRGASTRFMVYGGLDPVQRAELAASRDGRPLNVGVTRQAARRRQVARLHAGGMRGVEIAAELGVSPETVYRDFAALGLDQASLGRTHRRLPLQDRERLAVEIGKGRSKEDLAAEFGMSPRQVQRYKRKFEKETGQLEAALGGEQ